MGQTYTVELNLSIKSEPELVKRSNEYFRAIEVADKEEFINLNTVDEVLRSVFPNLHSWGGARYSADFDASYGWENVMYQWFKAVAPALKEGSTIEVWPDSGKWKCRVTGSGAVEELDEETSIKEAKETNFDFNAFEEHIPHEMRFKHAQVMPDGTLYWVTYGFFDARDLRDFRDALDKFTSIKKAFVTSRDVSTFDYDSDLRYEVGADIDLENNICNYENYQFATAEDEDEEDEDDFVTEGAEGKRDPGFEYVIYDYTDEDEGYCPIVAKRSTRIEAEATAATWMGNMYGKPARKKFEDRLLTFEKVPKGKFNVGDDFYGPFDDDWNKVESLHDEEPRFMYSRTENGKKFDIFRGVKGGKGRWSAKPDDGEEFEISYEQGVGEKPISGVADLGRTLGKKSGLKRQ